MDHQTITSIEIAILRACIAASHATPTTAWTWTPAVAGRWDRLTMWASTDDLRPAPAGSAEFRANPDGTLTVKTSLYGGVENTPRTVPATVDGIASVLRVA